MESRGWPLHLQPGEWEGLKAYVRRLAQAYGVSYDAFLQHALGRPGPGARDLDELPPEFLARLSAGTGVPVERLRAMMGWAVMVRLAHRARDWLDTSEGQEAIDAMRIMLSRKVRRMQAPRDP